MHSSGLLASSDISSASWSLYFILLVETLTLGGNTELAVSALHHSHPLYRWDLALPKNIGITTKGWRRGTLGTFSEGTIILCYVRHTTASSLYLLFSYLYLKELISSTTPFWGLILLSPSKVHFFYWKLSKSASALPFPFLQMESYISFRLPGIASGREKFTD